MTSTRSTVSALSAGLLSLLLLTACSDRTEEVPDQADTSAESESPATDESESEEVLEGHDEVPDGWPPEIPLPVGYEIEAVSDPELESETGVIPYHSAQVLGVSKEDAAAIVDEFEANGFTSETSQSMQDLGSFVYVNEDWRIFFTVAAMDPDGELALEDTGVYKLLYIVGPPE